MCNTNKMISLCSAPPERLRAGFDRRQTWHNSCTLHLSPSIHNVWKWLTEISQFTKALLHRINIVNFFPIKSGSIRLQHTPLLNNYKTKQMCNLTQLTGRRTFCKRPTARRLSCCWRYCRRQASTSVNKCIYYINANT